MPITLTLLSASSWVEHRPAPQCVRASFPARNAHSMGHLEMASGRRAQQVCPPEPGAQPGCSGGAPGPYKGLDVICLYFLKTIF